MLPLKQPRTLSRAPIGRLYAILPIPGHLQAAQECAPPTEDASSHVEPQDLRVLQASQAPAAGD